MTSHTPIGPDDIDEITAFLRTRWSEERANAAAYGSYDEPDNCWVMHTDPETVLADLEAKETLLDHLLAEPHTVCNDHWYTCCAATEERDGGHCPGDDHHHEKRCTCGRDARVVRSLQILAAPYTQHPDHKEHWRP